MSNACRILRAVYVILTLAILSAGAAGSADTKLSAGEKTDLGIIFSSKHAASTFRNGWPFEGNRPLSFWQPSAVDVARLEGALGPYLANYPSASTKNLNQSIPESKRRYISASAKKISLNLSDYRRQYIGYTEGARKFILVNAFCRHYWSTSDSWLHKPPAVDDGGACYFRIRFDVERGFDRFEFNGEA
jgi:hypothetical protein